MIRKTILRTSLHLTAAAFALTCLIGSSDSAFGQAGDFGNPPVLEDNGGQFGTPDRNDQDTGGGGGGSTGSQADGEIESVEPTRLLYEIPDRRNQGFVGPTAPGINELGFVGPLTDEPENGEDGVAEGRFQGGETNAGIGNRSATNSSAELQENGFTVQRRSIRTRLRPAFASPRMPAYVAERRFQSRMTRQPVVNQFGQGVTVTITNKTAVLTGIVSSNAERDIIKRQLRLEPGVYKIDDRTSNAR